MPKKSLTIKRLFKPACGSAGRSAIGYRPEADADGLSLNSEIEMRLRGSFNRPDQAMLKAVLKQLDALYAMNEDLVARVAKLRGK